MSNNKDIQNVAQRFTSKADSDVFIYFTAREAHSILFQTLRKSLICYEFR